MKKMLRTAASLLLCGCLMSASALAATTTTVTTFSDVPSTHWGYSFVTRAAKEGLVSGMGNGKFGAEEKLSAAQFTTMVCNIFYKSEVMAYQEQYKPAEWWRSYMAIAYTKGLLTNTTVGDSRASTTSWSSAVVNAEISRYDMAQIMVNVARLQGWQSPTSLELLAVQSKIADWDKIPAKYQTAVAITYAKGYLSGMDSIGTFAGDQSMTRTHGAVVVCKLLDAQNSTVTSNTYTNTVNLVNGKEPTQDNVESALATLKKEFSTGYVWNMTTTYRSTVLGNSTGAEAFAYMLDDRVFGNLSLNSAAAEDLKPGDIIYFSANRIYAVVQTVDGDEFTYVYCSSTGKVIWDNEGDIDDLTKQDTIYTRYTDTSSSSSSTTLSNGKKATESNAADLLDDFLYYEYDVGDIWDQSYKSTCFYSKTVYGDRAFAYYVSDYIFDELEVTSAKGDTLTSEDIRVGDVLYLDEEDIYAVVYTISTSKVRYYYVDLFDEVETGSVRISALTEDDILYTRYPD